MHMSCVSIMYIFMTRILNKINNDKVCASLSLYVAQFIVLVGLFLYILTVGTRYNENNRTQNESSLLTSKHIITL